MKTAQLLQTLNDQLSELAALVAPLAEHATLSPRFDRQLFHTRSTLMQAYLAEAQHNFNQLRQPSSASSCRRWSGLPSVWRHKSPRCAVKPPPVLAQLGPRVANVEPLAAPSPAASGV
ncbi:hypothetical protein KPZU09_34170 [Klebsiella pneumoniae]|uniref:Primosomal replication protein N n=1 Tax=Klebsiella pneumoniae TaxID=573 RepID=A0A919LNR7_KLEPN|nr:hypothetical protein KPZU09_34170 [Klebsiella pneumoniae]